MTIYQPLTKEQQQILSEFLESPQVSEGCLDYIATHGFLTGLASGPENLQSMNWMEFIFDGEPDYQNSEQQQDIELILVQLSRQIQRNLYLGEQLDTPCSFTVAKLGERNELTDWCFGFIEAIAVDEDSWFSDAIDAEAVAELILPAGILSEQFIDPDLEHLSKDQSSRQKMASQLQDNIQNLYLLFRETGV